MKKFFSLVAMLLLTATLLFATEGPPEGYVQTTPGSGVWKRTTPISTPGVPVQLYLVETGVMVNGTFTKIPPDQVVGQQD